MTSGDCIDPFNWIVEKHTQCFDKNLGECDWRNVNVRNVRLEEEIARRILIDDDLAKLEREDARRSAAEFEEIFYTMRPAFDQLFSR